VFRACGSTVLFMSPEHIHTLEGRNMLRLWRCIARELTVGKSCMFCSFPVPALSYFNSCRQEVGSTSEEMPFFFFNILLYFYYF